MESEYIGYLSEKKKKGRTDKRRGETKRTSLKRKRFVTFKKNVEQKVKKRRRNNSHPWVQRIAVLELDGKRREEKLCEGQ